MNANAKKIIVGVLAMLVSGAIGYYFFSGSGSLSIGFIAPTDNTVVGQDILVLADKLQAVSIDASLFSDVLFTTLKDASVSLVPEAQGRVNPFATIGIESSSVNIPAPIISKGL